MAQKEFQKLDLRDAFLFAAALDDPETCRLVLELIMGRPIGKKSRRLEESYMTMEELLADREAVGKAEGHLEGFHLLLNLVTLMVQDGLAGEIPRLKGDEDFCISMLENYHLK